MFSFYLFFTMCLNKKGYIVLVNSGSFEVEAERTTITEITQFIRQVQQVGYVEGFALIKSLESNEVITKIDLQNIITKNTLNDKR